MKLRKKVALWMWTGIMASLTVSILAAIQHISFLRDQKCARQLLEKGIELNSRTILKCSGSPITCVLVEEIKEGFLDETTFRPVRDGSAQILERRFKPLLQHETLSFQKGAEYTALRPAPGKDFIETKPGKLYHWRVRYVAPESEPCLRDLPQEIEKLISDSAPLLPEKCLRNILISSLYR